MEPYLKAFLLACYESEEPVFFPKKDKLNSLLQHLLEKPPKDLKYIQPTGDELEVIIPYFENLNIMSYNYLSPLDQEIFCKAAKQTFDYIFIDFMEKSFLNDMSKTDAIYKFLEKYRIPIDEKIEDTLRKKLYRSKRILRKYPTREYRKSRKMRFISSDEQPQFHNPSQ